MTQAEQLDIDISNVEISGIDNTDIIGMTIENIGTEDISVVSAEVSWSGVPGNRRLSEIVIDGNQGIEMFEKKEFDLVFTDLGMPGMSGWQVAERIKSIDRKTPVILITGWDINLNELNTGENGVDLIIQKPFEVEQILNKVQEAMVLKDKFKTV